MLADILAHAEHLFNSGRAVEARAVLEDLLPRAQGDPGLQAVVLSDLAVIAADAGGYDEAQELAYQAHLLCPWNVPSVEVLAYCADIIGSSEGVSARDGQEFRFGASTRKGVPPTDRPKRLLYVLNHQTLRKAEVPILRELGYEVFIPKILGDDPEFRSADVTYEYDDALTCSAAALAELNAQDFYTRPWSPTVKAILNQEFDVVVASWYLAPLIEAITHFQGLIVARVFGRELPHRYIDFFPGSSGAHFSHAIDRMGNRFVFGQGYDNLADVEPDTLSTRAHTITVRLPSHIFDRQGSWSGDGDAAIFLCPRVLESGYYRDRYEEIKRDFGDLPHAIFGRQVMTVDDPAILGDLTDDSLITLYAKAPVFVYPSSEPRHLHYSPIEAMVIGTPVLYRHGSQIDTLTGGANTPGACADTTEMRAKARALVAGDRRLADAIRQRQDSIVREFSIDLAARQWAALLAPADDR